MNGLPSSMQIWSAAWIRTKVSYDWLPVISALSHYATLPSWEIIDFAVHIFKRAQLCWLTPWGWVWNSEREGLDPPWPFGLLFSRQAQLPILPSLHKSYVDFIKPPLKLVYFSSHFHFAEIRVQIIPVNTINKKSIASYNLISFFIIASSVIIPMLFAIYLKIYFQTIFKRYDKI